MKFEEKFAKLRRDMALSQEELAEKLNVTRQTISKWELGQTKPDSEKIMEIAKLFNISVDELLNESDETSFNKDPISNEKPKHKQNNILIVIILVIIFIFVIFYIIPGLVGIFTFNKYFGNSQNIIEKAFNEIEEEYDNYKSTQNANETSSSNNQYTQNVIESSSTITQNDGHNVTESYSYNKETFSSTNEINQITNEINQMSDSINDIIKEQAKSFNNTDNDDFDKENFNDYYEDYVGVQSRLSVMNVINRVIQDNSKRANKVLVSYNGVIYSENSDIASMSAQLKNGNNYLITCEYDENGYVNKVLISDIK